MTRYGYFLSCEEYPPEELVRQARLAEEAGFDGLWISDHFHPWLDEQGESGFVWSVIGAISQATSLRVTTAVTCPLVRVHPAVIAQAAATSALLTGGKFSLGVGTGEALNEHILGDQWPPAEQRLEMLEEAVHVIRELLTGQLISHAGDHYTVDTARLYSVPASPRRSTSQASERSPSSWRPVSATGTCACSRTPTSSGSTVSPAAGTGRSRAA
jgi:G6PDH family F420-dependent oxidoreductase